MFAFATVVALNLALASNSAVYRCIGAHGETVFSGQPCTSADNQALGAVAPAPAAGATTYHFTCPADAQALRDRVAAAFNSGDTNAFGALFLWNGFGTRAAYARLRELGRILRTPMVDLHVADDASGPTAGAALVVTVGGDDAGANTTWQFPLVRQDGCTWLDFASPEPAAP